MKDDYHRQQVDIGDEQEIHLRDYLKVIRKRLPIIIAILVLVALASIVKVFTAVPIYSASTQVLVERNYGTRGLSQDYYRYEPEFLDTQSALIRSVNVGRRVVDKLDLTGRYRSLFIPEREERKPSFLAEVKKTVKGWIKNALSFVLSADKPPTGVAGMDGELPEIEPLTEEEMFARMVSGGLLVTPVPNTKIVSISYSHTNPVMAQMVANAVVQAYMDEILEIKVATSSYQLQWMTAKADQEREKLERAERALQQYMRDNDLVTVENRLSVSPQKLTEFSSQLSRAEAERKEVEALLAQIREAGDDFDKLENIPVFAENKVLKDLREKTYKARQNITDLSKKFGPKHPTMIKAQEEIDNLQKERRFEVQRVVSSTQNAYQLADSKARNLQELIDETKSEILDLNEKFIQYSILKREVDSSRMLFDTLQTSIKQEGVTEQSQSVNIWVVKEADMPMAPSHPNKRRTVLLGIILGLFGGVGLAFLIEYLDNTVKSEAELERRYGITVLGSVEMLGKPEDHIESYVVRHPLSPLAESYRLVRSSLLLSSAEKPPGVILITSMMQEEGKTATTINLARILAQTGKKVVVIDGDLRRPRMHTLFKMRLDNGLSSYLTGNSPKPAIVPVPGEDVALLTSGPKPPNPAELLSSKKMVELLQSLRQQFDFVLIDSPPVQSVTDGLALSKIADGTIVVVRFGKTTYELLNGGLKKLADVRGNILGFVLNGLKQRDARGYYYGYTSTYASDDKKA
ncbi:GumC family protein [Desulfofustis limnaeus]|uniref:non-specific protein-tyrosine kinase n=1 Tax=Desulfofustis limnaeus TaxID=2740163 RepID=A0ABM7W9N8_9BACT|nr:polysaccharide biosynthesis tyrosine autokinase [Desulfofustis limnaeus]BDD87649.1 chain-length determining protein [Desulfofustis limnaeus]